MRKVMIIIFAAICMSVVFSCNKEETAAEGDALTRGAGIVNDSSETDSGKVRYGDVVIDTTWAGETHINF